MPVMTVTRRRWLQVCLNADFVRTREKDRLRDSGRERDSRASCLAHHRLTYSIDSTRYALERPAPAVPK